MLIHCWKAEHGSLGRGSSLSSPGIEPGPFQSEQHRLRGCGLIHWPRRNQFGHYSELYETNAIHSNSAIFDPWYELQHSTIGNSIPYCRCDFSDRLTLCINVNRSEMPCYKINVVTDGDLITVCCRGTVYSRLLSSQSSLTLTLASRIRCTNSNTSSNQSPRTRCRSTRMRSFLERHLLVDARNVVKTPFVVGQSAYFWTDECAICAQ